MSKPNQGREELPLVSEMSKRELIELHNQLIRELNIARENFEFENSTMIQEKIREIHCELKERQDAV